jgi:uncharacterized membrane protein YvbJ
VAQRYCTNCGAELGEEDRFCPSCGQPTAVEKAPTPDPSVQSPTPQQPRQAGRWSAGRVLLLVFVAPVLLAIAWVVFQIAVGFLSGMLGG